LVLLFSVAHKEKESLTNYQISSAYILYIKLVACTSEITKLTTIMKKVILSLCAIVLFSYTASAQFHIELGPSFNLPQGDFADSYDLGVGFYLEPRYAMTENIDLGLHIGIGAFAGGDLAGGGGDVSAAGITPVLATGHYRFSTNKVSPYAGAGLGMYFVKTGDVSVSGGGTIEGTSDSEFGFAPRAGVFIGRMNLGVAYNIAGDLNYLQFMLGVRILSRD
jgi:outer membrane protein W